MRWLEIIALCWALVNLVGLLYTVRAFRRISGAWEWIGILLITLSVLAGVGAMISNSRTVNLTFRLFGVSVLTYAILAIWKLKER